jgi:hypothetical protein
MMKELGITDVDDYKSAITEILTQAFPQTGSDVNNWNVDIPTEPAGGGDMGMGGF